MPVSGNLYIFIDVEKNVHDRIGLGDVHKFLFRKNLLHHRLEVPPLIFAVEIIDHQETTAKQILS
jgi:hypothetical protein